MVAEVVYSILYLTEGSIILYTNNKKVVDKVNNELPNTNNYTQDTSSTISKIKIILKKAKIPVSIEQWQKQNIAFEDNLEGYLILKADIKSK